MINNLKALVVVLAIALVMFAIAKPVCLHFMAEKDFVRRRNVWIALTIAAFASPSFWLFAAIALPVLAWAASKDSNPLALYMLVFCIIPPIISFELPVVGLNALFRLNYVRLLAFAILIPLAWKLLKSKDNKEALKFTKIDWFVLGFAVLHLTLLLPYESITHNMRRWFLHFLDVMILYFVATRACRTRQDISEVMATFCLLCAVLAPIAFFESQRHWLLYGDIGHMWGATEMLQYASRGGSLRAQASAGQSIPLGFLLAFGFGLGLFLSARLKSLSVTIVFSTLMWAGMIAAHARAPWIAAVLIFFVYLVLGPNGLARFSKAFFASAILAAVLLASPIGGRIVDNLPFVGKVGAENVEYRQELAKKSWEQIKQNPIAGNPFVLKNLESLRQGEGIIDLLNAYTNIAMYYGLPALFLYLGPYLFCLWYAFRTSRQWVPIDQEIASMGAIMAACVFGFLWAMGAGGFGPYPTNFSIVVIGLSVAYARLERPKATVQTQKVQMGGMRMRAGR
jgi:O-Antigen ligase